jgi:hypothetical protein
VHCTYDSIQSQMGRTRKKVQPTHNRY